MSDVVALRRSHESETFWGTPLRVTQFLAAGGWTSDGQAPAARGVALAQRCLEKDTADDMPAGAVRVRV